MATKEIVGLARELRGTLRKLQPRVKFFSTPTWQETKRHEGVSLGALLTAPSKRAAKSGKFRNSDRLNGVTPRIAPQYGFKNAGIRHDGWQRRD